MEDYHSQFQPDTELYRPEGLNITDSGDGGSSE
jgi:hypothetical protein